MPHRLRGREQEIAEATEHFALAYKLSRQMALLMALLVCMPQVTTTTIGAKFGSIDIRNLVSRLRQRLRESDDNLTIHNVHGMGYYLDPDKREHLRDTVPPPVHV